jgi:hypothetical protein
MRRAGMGTVMAVLCGFVMAVAGGVDAASAKLPEWGQCREAVGGTGGKYQNDSCTVKAGKAKGVPTGGFEWHPASEERTGEPGTAYQLSLAGSIGMETASGKRVTCSVLVEGSHDIITGPKTSGTPLWDFKGCESEGQECVASHAPEAGEIEDFYAYFEEPGEPGQPAPGWRGKLGFISKPSGTVGEEYTVLNDERLFPPISCQGDIGTVWIGGDRHGNDSFIGKLEPVNEMTKSFTETYAASAPGDQSPSGFNGHGNAHLEAFLDQHWEPVALEAVFTYGFESEKAFEIKATP